jgi:hypothetical protein
MRKSVLGAAALALLGTTALVSAQQGPSGGGNQPGMKEQQGQSGGSGAQQSQGSAQKGEKNEKSDSRANAPSEKGKSSAQDETKGQGKNRAAESEGKGKAESKGTAQTEGKDKGDRNTAQDRARDQQNQKSARDRDQQNQKSARDRDNEQQKSARDRDQQNQKSARDRDNDRQKSARDREDNQRRQADDNQRGQRGDRDQRQQAQGGKGNETRVNISEQQRTSIHEKLSSHREARVSNVNFSINVGTRVPRSVHLSALPADVVSIVPQYRGYRYFIGPSDRIVIIQPSTLEIVEVIDVSSGPRRTGPVTASLELTPAQVSLIFDRIELSRYHADVNVNLALGAEIPSRVELYEFPQDVVSDVPELRRYRFVVVNREVVVVDPAKRDVVRVLKH